MNKEEFTKELVDIISRCLGELYLVEEKCITKNNNTKFQAISIQAKGKDAAMLIYVMNSLRIIIVVDVSMTS